MSAVAYLLDYHMDPAIADALWAAEPSIGVEIVGRGNAPPSTTTDPELLEYADQHSLSLVSFDKKTMPGHHKARLQASLHTHGVFIIRNNRWPPGRIADELLFVGATSTAEEWIDRLEWLPL